MSHRNLHVNHRITDYWHFVNLVYNIFSILGIWTHFCRGAVAMHSWYKDRKQSNLAINNTDLRSHVNEWFISTSPKLLTLLRQNSSFPWSFRYFRLYILTQTDQITLMLMKFHLRLKFMNILSCTQTYLKYFHVMYVCIYCMCNRYFTPIKIKGHNFLFLFHSKLKWMPYHTYVISLHYKNAFLFHR